MIQTERLILRRAELRDVGALFAIMSDPVTMAYWNTAPHETKADTGKLVRGLMRNKSVARYLIFEMDGALIGMGGLHNRSEIGYLLHPDYWGKGLAHEAISAIIANIWAETDLNRLVAHIDLRNGLSIRLIERLGFRETHRTEKAMCIDGIWGDSVHFALDRPTGLPS